MAVAFSVVSAFSAIEPEAVTVPLSLASMLPATLALTKDRLPVIAPSASPSTLAVAVLPGPNVLASTSSCPVVPTEPVELTSAWVVAALVISAEA